MILPARARRSRTCSAVRSGFCMAIFSVEQVGEALLDAVGDVERQRLDGRGRIDAAGGHPDAAVDDEEILHVMAAAPFLDHRTLGVSAHPRGADEMPAAVQDRALDADVARAGGGENLLRMRDAMLHHLMAVGADGVVELWRRDAAGV